MGAEDAIYYNFQHLYIDDYKAEINNDCNAFDFLFKICPRPKKKNIVDARTTEAENPVIAAYAVNPKTSIIILAMRVGTYRKNKDSNK